MRNNQHAFTISRLFLIIMLLIGHHLYIFRILFDATLGNIAVFKLSI
jgi:hypothetical protein